MNWFDISIVVIIIIAILKGFSSGLIMQIASLAGIVIGAIFAGQLSTYLEPQIKLIPNISAGLIPPVSFITSFLIIYIALSLIGRLLQRFAKIIQLNLLNRIAGAAFCCAAWLVLISILLNLVVEMDTNKKIIKEDIRVSSQIYPPVKDLAPKIVPYLYFNKSTVSEQVSQNNGQ